MNLYEYEGRKTIIIYHAEHIDHIIKILNDNVIIEIYNSEFVNEVILKKHKKISFDTLSIEVKCKIIKRIFEYFYKEIR